MMGVIKKKEGFSGQRSIVIPAKIIHSQCETVHIVSNLYITAIGYYPKALYHHRKRSHGVPEQILIYCVAGRGTVMVDRSRYQIGPGMVVVIPANVPHEYEAEAADPWTIYWIHFKGQNSGDYVDIMHEKMNGPAGPIPFQESRIQLFDDLYASVERGYSRQNIAYASIGLQYFLASCCFFENYLARPVETHDIIGRCISFMQEHLDRPLSLQEIAAAANLSASHCAAIFKKKTGHSVIEYFNHLKGQKACQYLQFTDLRVKEIADKLGIEDPYYFSRMFTKVTGMSPAKYRSLHGPS